MVYKNKKGQPRERAMVAAYSLVTDFGASQQSVADALGCSQPTVANWVKEVGYEAEIQGLKNQLVDAKGLIEDLREDMTASEFDGHEDDEGSTEDYVPDYGYESDEDNWEHAYDDVLKANDM